MSRLNPFHKRRTGLPEKAPGADKQQVQIEELKRLEAYRKEFLGNVSHELKTPLFNIQGYILTLLDGGMNDPDIFRDYLLRSEKNIDRMIAIIEDLETISQFETGELKINLIRFDLVALAKEVTDLLETKAAKKNIALDSGHMHHRPCFVMADKERIRQVLINLVDNSIKYGMENGHTVISFAEADGQVETTVGDNGIGIAPQNIPRLSERFFRVDKSRSREQGGSGLGLAIVKHILEAHGTVMQVKSSPGVGSSFSFRLKKP